MTDRSAELEAALLEDIERRWAAADRVRGRVIRPALRRAVETAGEPEVLESH